MPSDKWKLLGVRGVLEINIKLDLRVEKKGGGLRTPGVNLAPLSVHFLSVDVDLSLNGVFILECECEIPQENIKGLQWTLPWDWASANKFSPVKMSNRAHVLRLKAGPLFICLHVSQMKIYALNCHPSNSATFGETETDAGSKSWENESMPTPPLGWSLERL